MANGAVGHRKTMELTCECLLSLYFLCPIAPLPSSLANFVPWDQVMQRVYCWNYDGSGIATPPPPPPPTLPPSQNTINAWRE